MYICNGGVHVRTYVLRSDKFNIYCVARYTASLRFLSLSLQNHSGCWATVSKSSALIAKSVSRIAGWGLDLGLALGQLECRRGRQCCCMGWCQLWPELAAKGLCCRRGRWLGGCQALSQIKSERERRRKNIPEECTKKILYSLFFYSFLFKKIPKWIADSASGSACKLPSLHDHQQSVVKLHHFGPAINYM